MSAAIWSRIAFAETLLKDAAAMALAAYGDPALDIASKTPGDPVSGADLAIEAMLRAAIRAGYPQDGLIGEEYGRENTDAAFSWLIDPIDGTVNYIRRIGYFCLSIALVESGSCVAALILDPLNDELFQAGPDGVARLNGRPIRVAGKTAIEEAVIGLGFSARHDRALYGAVVAELADAGAEYRRLGSGALSLAHVAAGRLDAYGEPHMNPWDAVGGLYIAACAGALTIDYLAMGGLAAGAPVFAASPALGETLLAILPEPFSGTPLHREMRSGVPEAVRDPRNPHPNVETIP